MPESHFGWHVLGLKGYNPGILIPGITQSFKDLRYEKENNTIPTVSFNGWRK